MSRFTDKVALVTGAGSGLGQAVAVRLASEGAKVVVAAMNDDGAAETKRIIEEAAARP